MTDAINAQLILDWIDGVRGELTRQAEVDESDQHMQSAKDLQVSQWNGAYRFIATTKRVTEGEAARILDCPIWKIASARKKWGRCE